MIGGGGGGLGGRGIDYQENKSQTKEIEQFYNNTRSIPLSPPPPHFVLPTYRTDSFSIFTIKMKMKERATESQFQRRLNVGLFTIFIVLLSEVTRVESILCLFNLFKQKLNNSMIRPEKTTLF